MVALNGRLPAASLSPIPGGGRLLSSVAVTWSAICAEVHRLHGWTPTPTGPLDSYRPYDGNYYAQVETFLRRYSRTRIAGRPTKVWNGVTYWLKAGQATAAVPGTSNHGWACAVDVTGLGGFTGTRYKQFAAVASRYGWTNAEGRSIGEPWHWVDVGNAHLVKNGLSTTGVVPASPNVTAPTPIEEDDMYDDADRARDTAVYNWLREMQPPVVSDLPYIKAQVAALNVADTRNRIGNLQYAVGVLLARDPKTISAADIAAAIPTDIARAVADELTKRLAN